MTILAEQDFSLEKTGTNSYQCKDHSRKKREERDGVTYRAKARKRRKKRRRPRPRQQPRRKLSRGSCFVASRKYFFDEAMRTRNFFGGLQEGGRNCMANPLLKSIAPINLVCHLRAFERRHRDTYLSSIRVGYRNNKATFSSYRPRYYELVQE